jgi:hypothetical protein
MVFSYQWFRDLLGLGERKECLRMRSKELFLKTAIKDRRRLVGENSKSSKLLSATGV